MMRATKPAIDLDIDIPTFDYIGNGRVLVSITTKAGTMLNLTIKTSTFKRSIDDAVGCVNLNLAPILRDLGAL
jgi:hypothetical protein